MKKHLVFVGLAALRLAYAPAMLLGFNGAAICLAAQGMGHLALLALLACALLVSCLVEHAIPYQPSWNKRPAERWRDALHAVVNEGLAFAGVLTIPALTALFAGLPMAGLWPHLWPLWAQLLVAILVADAGISLMHWASHHNALLWRFHAVHHSVTRLYGVNGLLKNPLHQALEMAAGTAPLILAGMPQKIGMLLAFAVAVQLLLQHANVDMRIGFLRHLLALAPVHRFHHQNSAATGDVNFGLFTTLWDHLLGTAAFDPQRRFGPGDFGIAAQPDYPAAYFQQLLEPLRAKKLRP